MQEGISYKDSGVNIDEGNRFVSKIKDALKNKKNSKNLLGIGSFGGLYDLSNLNIQNPVLVSSIDGVGTKLNIAQKMNKHDSVGIDIVNHCVNDIIVQGAKPLYFSDYLGCGVLDADIMSNVIKGIVNACEESDLELIGGETAEMPGMYKPGEYDLVGSITGIVDKSKIITGENISEGDILIGLPSTGLHTNGYSLARKIVFDKMNMKVDDNVDSLNNSIGEELLIPHRSYSNIIFSLLQNIEIKGLAHITGGGMTENLPRILPKEISAEIDLGTIDVLPIFLLLKEWGNVDIKEMLRVFNMGIGMIIVVSEKDKDLCLSQCLKTYKTSKVIGKIISKSNNRVEYTGNI